jgi:hypothetical protein
MNLKYILPGFFVFLTLQLSAQNYLINFEGKGASNTVSTTKVENLTTGVSLTLNGNDTLNLTFKTGTGEILKNQTKLKIYPNPMLDISTLEFLPPVAGNGKITLYDITGRPLVQVNNYLENSTQMFTLSGIRNGFYLVTVEGHGYKISGRLISDRKTEGTARIEKISDNVQSADRIMVRKDLKNDPTIVEMDYSEGQTLRFTGYSGDYVSVVTVVPASDETITFNFKGVPKVATGTVTNISAGSAVSGGNVIADNGDSVTVRGVCWNVNADPTIISSPSTSDGAGTGIFSSSITNMLSNTTYHVRAYAVNNEGISYGDDVSFKTSSTVASLTTTAATSITRTTAISGGNITSDGGSAVTARGICWSTSQGASVTGSHTVESATGNSFTANLTVLLPATKYYYRAYATNGIGTSYGNELSFTTNPAVIATVVTAEVSIVSSAAAISGGNITDDGDSNISARGICWATSPSPTLNDNKTLNGSGTGSFISNLTGLLPAITYHVRAYATNGAGTAYGNDITFITPVNSASITTTAASAITRTTAVAGGNISSNGGAVVTVSGICWGTSHNPVTTGSHSTDGAVLGSFTSSMTGLLTGTLYYIRSYATNSGGTSYGNELSFTTGQVITATLTTTVVSSITSTTAVSGGNISDDGDGSITARGICWAATSSPTINDNITSNGTGKGSFTSNLTGLLPGAIYHVRAYATNSAGTSYGNDLSFTTSAIAPVLSTTSASSVTRTTAVSGGNITSDGGSVVTASGICWGTSHNPSIAGSHTSDGTANGSFTSNITGLTPGTLYYIRAYATNSVSTSYGNELSFTTSPIVTATLTTTAVTSITSSTANSGGNITDNGGGTITARGVCWATTSSPTISDNLTSNGTGTGSFTSSLTGLQPGTLYHVRAYATNSAGTSYGNDLTFTSSAVAPTLTTTAASSIARTSASSGGTVTSNGGSAVTASGVCWSTSHNPSTSGSHTTDGPTSGSFTSGLTGLSSGTLYYIRAYATNSVGTSYGNELSFTTNPAIQATLSTTVVSSVTATTAVSGGNITNDGDGSITARGVCWATTASPTISNSITSNGTGSGSFTSNLTGLLPVTTYHVRAYATNSAGTAYGNEVTFTTTPVQPATLTTTAVTAITSSTANSGGNITDNGGGSVTARGVCWATNSSPTISDNLTSNGTGNGSFTANLTGLQPGTLYHVRAYATNSAGTAYGNDLSFTTSAVAPVLTTTAASSIDRTSATGGGNITSNGGSAITVSGICWSTSHNPSTTGTHTSDGTTSGSFSSNITGLSSGTLYYLRAYATNSVGTSYGNELSFTTNPAVPATLTTTAVTSITAITGVSGGNITNDGDGTITARGICWSTNPAPTIADNLSSDGTGKGSFSSNLTGLLPVNTYYVRAYATNSAGTAYGNEVVFTTIPVQLATLTTTTVTSVTSGTAVSGGNITDNGGGSITARGVCWATTASPTINDNLTSNGTGNGIFTSNITGLQTVTTYHVRAYATNSAGTAYGNELTFTTTANPPSITTTAASSVTRTTAISGGTITTDGGASITVSGICWSTSHNPSVTGSHTTDGTSAGSFSSNMSGLSSGTLYYIRAYATNSTGTSYGNELSFTTNPAIPATLTTTDVTAITYSTAASGGNISDDGDGAVTARGVCWATTSSPTTGDNVTSNGTGKGSFVSNMTGMQPGTTYHVRAYATNSAGTSYGNEIVFTTTPVQLAVLTTTAITSIFSNSAVSGGNITDNGGGAITARGVCWSTGSAPTISNSLTSNGTGSGSFTSNLTGLVPVTTYHVRAYATNSAGTSYGNELTFTTPDVLPVVTTTAVSSVTQTTAVSGGNVVTNGGGSVTARGVCWSTSSNPTISNSKTTDGTGAGSFSSNITGFAANTRYYVRAYATNSAGTAYGNEVTFMYITTSVNACKWLRDASCFLNLSFDDAQADHLDIANILSQNGLKGTFYTQTADMEINPSLKDVYKSILSLGHEVGSHTVDHLDMTTLSDADLYYQVDSSMSRLNRYLKTNITSLAHPYHAGNDHVNQIIFSQNLFTRDFSEYSSPIRDYFSLKTESTISEITSYVESHIASSGMALIAGHGINGQGYSPMTSDFFTAEINYVKSVQSSRNVWVSTMSDGDLYETLFTEVTVTSQIDQVNHQIKVQFNRPAKGIYSKFSKLLFSFRVNKNSAWTIQNSGFDYIDNGTYFIYTVDLKSTNQVTLPYNLN